ncbi:MAG: twin-arginine translocase TatA/TatE family subunit [Bacillota bacterium]|nr:twin-arginine translocase TatA/TatE family subunit [Bacillota bacterium]
MDLITPGHLLVILIIALILFGPRRLPELGRSLGDAIREFRSATSNAVNTVASERPRSAGEEKPAGEGTGQGGQAGQAGRTESPDEGAGERPKET